MNFTVNKKSLHEIGVHVSESGQVTFTCSGVSRRKPGICSICADELLLALTDSLVSHDSK
jgi:hypothetical protein